MPRRKLARVNRVGRVARMGGGAAAWTPASAPGYADGIDIDPAVNFFSNDAATTPSVDGGNVVRFHDAKGSAAGSYAQSAVNYSVPKLRTEAGFPCLHMPATLNTDAAASGSEFYVEDAVGLSFDLSACTVYVVARPDFRAANAGVISLGGSFEGVFGNIVDGSLCVYAPSFPSTGAAVVATDADNRPYYRWQYGRNCVGYACGPSSVVFDTEFGVRTINTSAGAGTRTGVRIGRNGGDNNNFFFAGRIFRILVYPVLHDATTRAKMTAYLRSYYGCGLTALTDATPLVVTVTDSRTFGQTAYVTEDLANRAATEFGCQIRNVAVGGTGSSYLLANATEVDAMYSAGRPANVLVVWSGINDAYSTSSLDDLWDYCDARRAVGWDVIVCSELPNHSTADTARQAWLTKFYAEYTAHSDGMADYADDAIMGVHTSGSPNATYWADNLHPRGAGYGLLYTNYLSDALDALLP